VVNLSSIPFIFGICPWQTPLFSGELRWTILVPLTLIFERNGNCVRMEANYWKPRSNKMPQTVFSSIKLPINLSNLWCKEGFDSDIREVLNPDLPIIRLWQNMATVSTCGTRSELLGWKLGFESFGIQAANILRCIKLRIYRKICQF